MKEKQEYKAVDIEGDTWTFSSIDEYQKMLKHNPELFIHIGLEGDEPVVAEAGYVNPDHYLNRKYEVFDVMRDTQTYGRHIGYLEGCVIKYMMRWDKKHDDPLQDLNKAKRYLEQLIKTIEEEQQHVAMARN